ncbi:PREDICTED: uncharacterized protein LOC109591327 [Amphimedon queenslandica]|uniref:Uncharacterized protein n=2 Tax=Amphimedon queenslandica TaxID=400682 RepID=A0AAN0JZJ1_AMPQE|nr:PREDICTED: uncharacterized protein LOC109591327 [Amphimedon queenslandica]|eukprot:XP_019862641.1 PREDICTED: uncharacterized protein LOC109591327 [Amphimedon queenslandica]
MDCTRYCEQAQKKLDEAKEKLMEREKKFKNMVKDKKRFINDFETQAENLKYIYKKDSEFSKELVTAFDKDLEKTNDKIENISKLHFQKFRSRIKEMKGITTEQFNLEAEDFFRQENDLLKNDLLDLPFISVQKAVGESINALASARGDMKQCMALYCNTVCTSTKVKSNLPEAGFISESVCNDTTAVSTTPPIKLKDLLEQSQVHYSILKKIIIFLTGWFLKFPKWTRTIDEFLDELEKYFLADCHEYFTKIKPAIVESYRKKYSKTAEDDIEDVKKQFSEEKKAMDTLVKKWNKRAKRNKKKAKSYSDLIDTLEKQKVHLVSLAQRAHGISLSAVSQT